MLSTLYRSGRRVSEADVQALAEFLRSTDGAETKLHRLIEGHPAIIGALGYVEFLSEFPLTKRGSDNQMLVNGRGRDRADIVAARLSIVANLQAKKFANLVELKGARDRVTDHRSKRRSQALNTAINELRDYSAWLTEINANREAVYRFGWDVWNPAKIVIMGSTSEFENPGQADKLKQELLDSEGVQLFFVDELLGMVESVRRQHGIPGDPSNSFEGLVGFAKHERLTAPLILASGGLAGFVLASRRLNGILTPYGDIDVRNGVPIGLTHVQRLRLQPLARRLEIPFAEALIGFSKYRSMYKADKFGIVVADFDGKTILQAAELRDIQNEPLRRKRAERKAAQQRLERENTLQRAEPLLTTIKRMFPKLAISIAESIAVRATEPFSGRVGTNPALEPKEAAWLAVAAYAAYEHLGPYSAPRERVREVLADWGGPRPEDILRDSLL